jgi:hypothetical protein
MMAPKDSLHFHLIHPSHLPHHHEVEAIKRGYLVEVINYTAVTEDIHPNTFVIPR